MTLQDLILKLSAFWASRGCLIQQPLDIEVGAGTSHPETLLRVRQAAVYFVCATVVTYMVAVLSYHLLEKHFLGLKRFFVSGRTRPPLINATEPAPE